jgi:hypothetical protein
MTARANEILRDALSLDDDERAVIAAELLASFHGAEAEIDAAWVAEIERRESDALAGRSEHEDWRTALADIERQVLGR